MENKRKKVWNLKSTLCFLLRSARNQAYALMSIKDKLSPDEYTRRSVSIAKVLKKKFSGEASSTSLRRIDKMFESIYVADPNSVEENSGSYGGGGSYGGSGGYGSGGYGGA